MRIRKRRSYLTSLPETVAPEKTVHKISHWLYLVVLLIVFGYFLYYLYLVLTGFEGYGQVKVEKTNLSSTIDGNLSNIAVSESQVVAKGELIASLTPAQICDQKPDFQLDKLSYEIELKNARIDSLRQQLAGLRESADMLQLRRALELDDDLYDEIQQSEKLRFQLGLLIKERDIQQQLRRTLGMQLAVASVPKQCQPYSIVAPFDGIVKKILFNPQEFVKKGDPIVIYESFNAPVTIEAFLSKHELKNLAEGANVDIAFPDGRFGTGIIEAIHSTAYAFPKVQWEDYEPLDTRIRIKVIPIDQEQALLWKNYDLMRVRVEGSNQ